MNIGINARLLLSHYPEGIARYIFETVKVMAQEHPNDTFYLFFDRKPSLRYIVTDNMVPIVVGPQARHPILYKIWFDYSLPNYLVKYKIDVFYSGDSYMSLNAQCPTVIVTHDLAFRHYPSFIKKVELDFYRKNFPKYFNKAKHIVAVSNFTKEDIQKKYKISEEKISVGYNALPSLFEDIPNVDKVSIREQYAQGQEYFLCVSSIHPRKNISRLIRAYNRFRRENTSSTKLLIIGRKSWKSKEFEKSLRASPFRNDILHYDNIGEEIVTIVSSAKVMVYTSLFEGFGIPILEAFASRVPVITSNVSSMPEIAGDAALLVNPQSPAEISNAMFLLDNSEELRKELINKGVKRLEHFSWQSTARHIYEHLLAVKPED